MNDSKLKSVTIKFRDDGPDSLEYDVDDDENLRMEASDSGHPPTIYLNKEGCIKLAEILIKLGKGSYRAGFHIHLEKNFDPDSEEVLCLTMAD